MFNYPWFSAGESIESIEAHGTPAVVDFWIFQFLALIFLIFCKIVQK